MLLSNNDYIYRMYMFWNKSTDWLTKDGKTQEANKNPVFKPGFVLSIPGKDAVSQRHKSKALADQLENLLVNWKS